MEGRHRLIATLAVAALAATAGPRPAAAQDAAGPSVSSTPALGSDPERERAWAAFFDTLPHGAEIASLHVLLGTGADVTARCGPDAAGCYFGLQRLLVMPGGAAPGAGITDEIARHEYGHHLAAASDNAPFAPGLGTKRWFTREHVCQRLRTGELVDDAAEGYGRSVAEVFAESYRVASGGQSHQWVVGPALFPDAGAQRAILADVQHPWTGPHVQTLTVRGRVARVRVRVPLDGTVTVSATDARRLWLEDATGHRVARGHRHRAELRVRWVDCGVRRPRILAVGRSGLRLKLSTP